MNAIDILTRLETDMMRISTDFSGGDKMFVYMTYDILMNSEGEPKPIRRKSVKDCVWESMDVYKPEQIVDLSHTRKCREVVSWLETYMLEMSIYRSPVGRHIRLDFEPFDYDMDAPPINTVRAKTISDAVYDALSMQMTSAANQELELEDNIIKMFKNFRG